MIVDVHCHTPTHRDSIPADERQEFTGWRTDRTVVASTTWADFDAINNVADVAIIFNIDVPDPGVSTIIRYDPARTNDATAEFVAAAPTRRIGFMSVDPRRPDALEEADRCRELGLVGLKLGANYQHFDPLGDQAERLYQYCQQHRLPILFHQGASPIRTAPLRYTHPLATDEIAIRFPELRIVMAHMGHPWTTDTVVTIRKHPHVYADISGLFTRPWGMYQALLAAQDWGCGHKLLFGSDYPILHQGETIDGLRRVNDLTAGTALPRVRDDLVERIIHADALSALGLTLPTA